VSLKIEACIAFLAASAFVAPAVAQQAGSIRGRVIDQDFDAPLGQAQVLISETGQRVLTSVEGNYVFTDVAPGTYTLVFSKDGYTRQLRMDVPVTEGQLTEVSAALPGDFVEMEEFMAREVSFSGATEAGLLRLRLESPALLDSIGAQLISRSGANDAAAALRLVAGASTEDGRFPVIRGLPDRYVSSQLNGVRLPTADADKRAVALDLFPATAIESIQVSKTFTPDQQGDASGGAVNLVLKGIPDRTFIRASAQYTYNTQVRNRKDFLTYQGGGIPDYWGYGDSSRDIQYDNIGKNWTGAVGVSEGDAPTQYKWNVESGGRAEDDDFKIGGYQNLFYEQDAEYFDNGIDDKLWVVQPGQGMVPRTSQGTPDQGEFKTSLFDITQGTDLVRWGWLGTGGIEFLDTQKISVTYLYTRIAQDTTTLAEDTRGKAYFFPGYNPDNINGPGNSVFDLQAAPYLRTETLNYTEESTQTLMFNGRHELPLGGFGFDDFLEFGDPELDWTIATSEATFDQPDKRQFGSLYWPNALNPGFPPFLPPFQQDEVQRQFKPDANFLLGNLQRTWQNIEEDSTQGFGSIKLPFTQWTDSAGFFKFGAFDDSVTRTFNQDGFSNFNDNTAEFFGPFSEFWSKEFPNEDHPLTDGPPFVDVDYRGKQDISAWYAMTEVPLVEEFSIIGGARRQSTSIGIVNSPEEDATWFPPGSVTITKLNPGDADVSLDQYNTLPQIGFTFRPIDWVTVRGNYAETIALPIFKELTPILQQEFLGADVFIGNPDLQISEVQNWDIRLDLTPFEGGLLSGSYFYKSIENPIEYVQRVATFTYTTPVNFPKGTLDGVELEARQGLGAIWEGLQGLTIGANATFINSNVRLPQSEIAAFAAPNIQVPTTSRNITGTPEYLWNLFMTLDVEETGTQFGVFYTVKGDTLLAGAGVTGGNFVPDVYSDEFGTLNLTLSQKLGEHFKLTFQAKNLTDPTFKQVYRSSSIGDDVTKSAFTLGVDLSIALSAEFTF